MAEIIGLEPERVMCPVRALKFYLQKTKECRGPSSNLWCSMMAGSSADKEMPDFMIGSCLTMCPSAEVRLCSSVEILISGVTEAERFPGRSQIANPTDSASEIADLKATLQRMQVKMAALGRSFSLLTSHTRDRQNGLVHPLAKGSYANGEKLNYGSQRFMVKEFSRSAAGHEIKPSDIRPLPVLAKTVKYLLTNSCCRTDVSWVLIYQFVSDRLRAVRQDLCVQGVRNLDCIKLHLASVRFHVYSHYRMCENELADFDPYLNKKMLLETLTLILALYQDLHKEMESPDVREQSAEPQCENEGNWTEEEGEESEKKIMKDAQTNEKNSSEEATAAGLNGKFQNLDLQDREETEFENDTNQTGTESESRKNYENIEAYSIREEAEAFYILVNFGNEEALSHALTLPKHIRCSSLVSLVSEMGTSWLTHNYCRVIHLSTFLPPLFLCAFHPHIAEVERKALSIMSRSHSCKGQVYKKDDLAKMLFFSDHFIMKKACEHYGIEVTESGVVFSKASFKVDAPLRKVTRLQWIEGRLNKVSLTELLTPQDLQDGDFSSLLLEPGKEEEDPVLVLPEVMLTRGSGVVAEACDEKDITLDPADEPDWIVDNNSMVHPKEAEEVSTKFPLDNKVLELDQDDVDKLPQHSINKEPVVVPENGEEACSCSDVSVHLLTKPMHKDTTYNEIEGYASIISEMCPESPEKEVKENAKLQEQDSFIPFSGNGSVHPSEQESLASEDSGVSFDSVNQVLCDSALSEDSPVIFNEFSKKGDVSTGKSSLYCMDSNLNKIISYPHKTLQMLMLQMKKQVQLQVDAFQVSAKQN
ncbi:uncharacterized protein LOC135218854 [Macrobrachium nipponense]|uniref:uncharacterized protein LOC135218854 n=1 Tax=Macrobrachium nipponense TaxID=159736 RepID=UPI0030C80AAE